MHITSMNENAAHYIEACRASVAIVQLIISIVNCTLQQYKWASELEGKHY